MIPLSCQMSDAPSVKYFQVISLCGCIELYDVNVKYHILSILYFEMIFYFIKSIRLSQWAAERGWRCGGRTEILRYPLIFSLSLTRNFKVLSLGPVPGLVGLVGLPAPAK